MVPISTTKWFLFHLLNGSYLTKKKHTVPCFTEPESLEHHGGEVYEIEGGEGGEQLIERVTQISSAQQEDWDRVPDTSWILSLLFY